MGHWYQWKNWYQTIDHRSLWLQDRTHQKKTKSPDLFGFSLSAAISFLSYLSDTFGYFAIFKQYNLALNKLIRSITSSAGWAVAPEAVVVLWDVANLQVHNELEITLAKQHIVSCSPTLSVSPGHAQDSPRWGCIHRYWEIHLPHKRGRVEGSWDHWDSLVLIWCHRCWTNTVGIGIGIDAQDRDWFRCSWGSLMLTHSIVNRSHKSSLNLFDLK